MSCFFFSIYFFFVFFPAFFSLLFFSLSLTSSYSFSCSPFVSLCPFSQFLGFFLSGSLIFFLLLAFLPLRLLQLFLLVRAISPIYVSFICIQTESQSLTSKKLDQTTFLGTSACRLFFLFLSSFLLHFHVFLLLSLSRVSFSSFISRLGS